MTKPIQVKNTIIGCGIPKICVPLTASDKTLLLKEAEDAVAAGADLVEWRADFYEDLLTEEKMRETLGELSGILGEIPLIFTIRTSEEGGNCEISISDYSSCNLAAAQTGMVDFVDVQVFGREADKEELIRRIHAVDMEKGRDGRVRVIASSHDFQKTDDREALLQRFRKMDATGADILKMAVMPKVADDVAAIMQATNEMRTTYTEKPLISMSMGSLGSISRISGENFGSSITFGTVGEASAPGQFPIGELRRLLLAMHEKNVEEA